MREEHAKKIRIALDCSWIPFEDNEIEMRQIMSLCENIQMDCDLCFKRWEGKYLKWMRFYDIYPERYIIPLAALNRIKSFQEIKKMVSDIVRPSSVKELIELVKEGYRFHLEYDDWKDIETINHFIDMTPISPYQFLLCQSNQLNNVDKFTFDVDINDLKGDTK